MNDEDDDFVIDTSISPPVLNALSWLETVSDGSVEKLKELCMDFKTYGLEMCSAFHLFVLLTITVKRQKKKLATRKRDAQVAAAVEEMMRAKYGNRIEEEDDDVIIIENQPSEGIEVSGNDEDVIIVEKGESEGKVDTIVKDANEDEEDVELPFDDNPERSAHPQDEVCNESVDTDSGLVIDAEESKDQSEDVDQDHALDEEEVQSSGIVDPVEGEVIDEDDASEDKVESSGTVDGDPEDEKEEQHGGIDQEQAVEEDEMVEEDEEVDDDSSLIIEGELEELDEYEEEEGEVVDTDEDEEKEREWRRIAEQAQDHSLDLPRASSSNDSGEPVAQKKKKNKKKKRDSLFVSPPPRTASPQLELINLRGKIGSVACVFCLAHDHASLHCSTFTTYRQREYIREKRGLCWHCLGRFKKDTCRAASHMKICTACSYQHFSHPAMCRYLYESNGPIDRRVPRKRKITNELSARR